MLTLGQEATASKRPAYSAHGNSAQSPLQAHEAVQRHRANLDIRPKRPVRRLEPDPLLRTLIAGHECLREGVCDACTERRW